MKTLIVPTLLACLAQLGAADLVCDGILGNSGGQGAELVRGGTAAARGLGPAVDRFGTLWDRGGSGQLVRYALDGRALATVAIPASASSRDQLALVGDVLIVLAGGKLATIDLAATPLQAVPSKLTATRISRGSHEGAILVWQEEDGQQPALFRWDPRSGARTDLPLPPPPAGKDRFNALECDGDAVVVRYGSRLSRLADGTWSVAGTCGGDRLSLVDGAWWTAAWHGTVQRFDTSFAPDPGVVLGGASGSFIGHLDGNYEVSNPTGIALAEPGLFAIGGLGCVAHLARWDDAARALTLVRRIGALQGLNGHLAIDGQGRIHVPWGTWLWSDAPDTPLRDGTPMGGNGQVAVLASGALAGSATAAGPGMVWGTLDKEVSATGARFLGVTMALPENVTGCTVLPDDGRRRILRITASGEAFESVHSPDGKPQKEVGAGKLTLSGAATTVTSLALTADGRVLAGADGCILELERGAQPGDWHERSRSTSIAGEALAGAVRIAADGDRLWVADAGNNRVLACDQRLTAIQARFGGQAGDDLAHCDHPAELAAAGGRAVVYDAGNQRLLKLELK